MKYTVSMATWYDSKWHLDPMTETRQMTEQEIIEVGHMLAEEGAMPLYTEYVNNTPTRVMIEHHGHLEPAFTEMVA